MGGLIPNRRPHILLVTTDQQRGDCIGYDRRGVQTPHLDRLAGQGTRFAACITPNPMCQPARASILTGKLLYTTGVRDNGRNLDETLGEEGVGSVFARAGYRTDFIGKAHFSSHETFGATGRPECYTSTACFPADWGGPYFGFRHVQLTLRPHHHCVWNDPPYTLHFENFLNGDGQGRARWQRAKEQTPPPTDHLQAWRTPLEDRWQSTTWIGDRAVELIDGLGETPEFAWISFPDPHPPFLASAPWSHMYDPAEVDIAPHRTRDLERRPWWHSAFMKHRLAGDSARNHAADGKDWSAMGSLREAELRQITAIYFCMISAIDHQIGRMVEALEKAGLSEDVIIVFTSDHGEWLGDNGLLLKGPMLYDGLLRVPLLIAGPGVPAGKVIADPVSSLDLRATLAELAGIVASPDNGRSLVPVMQNRQTRDFALNEWEVDAARSGVALDLRTVRTRRHRMSVDLTSGAGELYDFENDPFETTNLWADTAHAKLRSELMEMIRSRPDDMIPAAVGIRNQLLVKVTTEDGLHGWGESGLSCREGPVAAAIEHFAAFLVGRDSRQISRIWQEAYRSQYFEGGRVLTAAMSAIDIALYDILGKRLGVPVHQLLGGKQRDEIPTFPSCQGRDIEELVGKAKILVDAGWDCLRIYTGEFEGDGVFAPRQNLNRAVKKLIALRDAFGPELCLGIDLHHRFSVAETADFCARLPQGTLDFLEEPIRCQSPKAYRMLRTMTTTPFAIGEEFSSKWEAMPYIEEGLTQYMRLDICNIGGFTEAMKVAGWCEAHYVDLMPHNPLGPVCTAATVHMAAAVANFSWAETRQGPTEALSFHDPELFPVQIPLDGITYKVPDRPGLGVEVDEEKIRKSHPEHVEPPHLHRPDGSVTNW